jgi:hypothetical protein
VAIGLSRTDWSPSILPDGEKGLSSLVRPTDAATIGLCGKVVPLAMGRLSFVGAMIFALAAGY